MVEAKQYGGGHSVQRGLSSVRWRIVSTGVSHQYGGGTSSVWQRVCSMKLPHHQYGGGCVAQDYQNCSGGSWWLYLSGGNDILKTILL